jgi:hypothetical protein
MKYLKDYLHFTSGTECPEPYRVWAGLSLLAAVLGRKVWTYHGRFEILPSLYVILVGDAGSGKSTAKNDAKKIFTSEFPQYMSSASFQSHQDIIDLMCNAQPRVWEERNGDDVILAIHGYTPFYIVCNEFSSLLSTDKKGMVEFLVDIYDENEFSTGFKTQRAANPEKKQKLDNPYVNVLACAVPKWFMGNLKMDLFDGGLGRRLIIVYSERTGIVDNPIMVPGGAEARTEVLNHLKLCEEFKGQLKRTPDSMLWWKEWYHKTKSTRIDDPILMQFYQTKPVQVLKVAMLLTMCEAPLQHEIEPHHLQNAVTLIDELEPNVVRLTSGIGRNELAGVGVQLLDFLARMGGAASEMQVKKYFRRYMDTKEFIEVLQSFIDTKELVYSMDPSGTFRILMLPDYAKQMEMKKKLITDSTQ